MYILSLLALFAGVSAVQIPPVLETLQQHRAVAEQLIPYTADERVRVAQESKKMFEMYVNREAKMALYGKKIDPLPQIETIIGEAPKMSDREFHDSMSKVFKSQRDGHLIYSYPGTQSCFTVHTGLKFDLVDSGEAVVVSIVSTIAQGSAPGQMQYGDSLVGFDGLSLSQRYESLKWEISGSNTESGMRRVLFLLSSMLGSRFKMPARDTFDLMMKRRETGEEYKVTLPWLVSLDKTCLKEASAVIKGNLAKRYLERRGNTARIFASGSLQETMFEKRAKVEPVTGMPWVKTENSAVMWQKFRLDNFNLGILRISTFAFASFNEAALDLVEKLLRNKLADTDGLLLDMRDNTGGSVASSASLVTLFKETPVPMNGHFKITKETRSLYENSALSKGSDYQVFVKALRETPSGQQWSITFAFPDYASIPKRKVAYTKPVGILNNANCFSSCEFFTAMMKDNGVATVFGEDTTTRGGGATVMAHKGTFAAFDANMFTPLPFAGDRSINSKLVSQDMSITFCQVRRQNGKLIEDFGVEVDYLVRPSVGDVLPGGQSLRQLSMIAGVLGKKAPASK